MKVKFSKKQTDLFNIGTIVNTADGSIYRYLPFWFKETDEEGVMVNKPPTKVKLKNKRYELIQKII